MDLRTICFRLLIAMLISAVIGVERSVKRHSAGLRTFMIVTLAGTAATLADRGLPLGIGNVISPCHLSLVVLACSGAIAVHSLFRNSRNQIEGLTTAAALFTSCLIGIFIGAGLLALGICVSVLLLIILSMLPWLESFMKNRSNHFEVHLELTNGKYLENFITTIRRLGMSVDDIELNRAYKASELSVYSISMTIQSAELKKYKTHKDLIEALKTLEYVSYIEEM